MKVDILTIFPAMVSAYLEESIIKRAIEDQELILTLLI